MRVLPAGRQVVPHTRRRAGQPLFLQSSIQSRAQPALGQPQPLCCTHTNHFGVSCTGTKQKEPYKGTENPIALPGEGNHVLIWLKTPLARCEVSPARNGA